MKILISPMTTIHLLALSALLCFGATAKADEHDAAQQDDTLFQTEFHAADTDATLNAYITTALENNQALRAAFDDWQAALEQAPQSSALPNPKIQWTHFVEEVQTRTGPQHNRFSLSQEIPWKGKRAHARIIAEIHAEMTWWVAEELRLEIIQNLKRAYYEYAYLAESIRIVGDNIMLLHNLEPIVQARVRGGASQGDLLKLQIEIAKLEDEREALTRLRPAQSRQLGAILNYSRADILPWPELAPPDDRSYRVAELMKSLDTNNAALKRLQHQIRKADHHVTHVELDKRPDFTVGITYIDTHHAVGAMKPSDSGSDPFSIDFGMSIPIWHKKNNARVRQAKSQHSSVRRTLAQKRFDLHAELEMQVYHLEDAARRITLYKDTLIPRTMQAVEIMQVEYQSGNAALLDIIDSERELLSFEKSYWSAVRDYRQRLADLEGLCGGEL
jgi:outer membrane protein TolC